MDQSKEKIEYFLYARKSSESEDRQVQSIDDQVSRLNLLAKERGLSIKRVLREAKSAKKPGDRPVFAEMMERIEGGEVGGILCWQINRLSRNPVDSGRIQWLLQQGILQSIQTPERVYRPEDNTLLFSVESGMANQFIIDLRKNTLRGMHSKVEKGWAPILAPLGYLNEEEKHTIVKDPRLFPVIRKMWDLMLTGSYTGPRILQIASREWGLRTKKYKRRGGGELSVSGIYRLFTNIFYTGLFDWGGKRHQGKHEPMISMEEYNRVQELLGTNGKPRPQRHIFPFTGFIRCGDCGCSITAEEHTKIIKKTQQSKTFIYYHCTRKKQGVKCTQRSMVSKEDLEEQVEREIIKLTILPEFRDWALEVLRENNDTEIQTRTQIYENQQNTLNQTQAELDALTRMRYRELIDDETYVKERDKLQGKILGLRQAVRKTEGRADRWLELSERTFNFALYAHSAFLKGGPEVKKEILMALGSNPILNNKKLSIEANSWFARVERDYPALEKEYLRLEPGKEPMNKAKTDALSSVRAHWGARRESNPRDRLHRAAFYH